MNLWKEVKLKTEFRHQAYNRRTFDIGNFSLLVKWICSILSSYKRRTIHPYGRSSAGHLTPWQCMNTCVEDSALLILNCYAPVLLPLSIQKSRHGSKHYCNVLILRGNSYITSKRSLNIIRFALFKPPNPHDGALIETCL